jgi:hypothetical protein
MPSAGIMSSLPNPAYSVDNRLELSDEDVNRIANALKGPE